jgi:hypothetical protein
VETEKYNLRFSPLDLTLKMILNIPVVKSKSANRFFISLSYFLACNCYLCTSGFDTSYPHQLQNHINPDDFQQSIKNINNHFPQAAYCCRCCVALLSIIGSGFLFVGGPILYHGLTANESDAIFVGTILLFIWMIIWCLSCCCFCRQRTPFESFRRAVEVESEKYEPQHCRWRLIRKKDEPSLLMSRRQQVPKFHVS